VSSRPDIHALSAPALPVTVGRSSIAPVLTLAALFALVGAAAGLPIAPALLLGGIGGTVSLIVHELGHVSAARQVRGVRPVRVSLFWGGAAVRMDGAYQSGLEQARVAIAGPAASFAFAVALVPIVWLPMPAWAKELVVVLILFNVAICALNLIPAHPLDGHKVVHGLLWSAIGSESRARRAIRRGGKAMMLCELPGAVVLLVERPLVGGITIAVAASVLLQKPLLRLLPFR
jgi:Zn-dependent protease